MYINVILFYCVISLIFKYYFSVLKTGDPKGFQSSNLCASARLNKGLPKGSPFVFWALRI
ncbi:hypothetical protein DU239_23475 [Salmonella enterica subsp. enterica]|uniref:Uncharacterized protein n=1 Tax=Salmonella enterica subsp. enterica serovar Cerro TaxID=340188 RepID=A0A5W9FJ30_SALET|nr:hypothetical protein [Salmonella enterica subsp. enterica serovar Cerro]ECI0425108.1 hypothetical protein [Salmonella enterica subsp. enterica]EBX1743025.1 hypothetical protein [Salmonella enterica subsp. enterica serovar Cerro]EBY3767149.1 hypothetical protein [Salmonella enterica subsp. enterica serovar Cerro]ECI0343832.1 hypothetical protein [Salmonella enterica subsp. enterica serovar Cerro]